MSKTLADKIHSQRKMAMQEMGMMKSTNHQEMQKSLTGEKKKTNSPAEGRSMNPSKQLKIR